MKNSIMLFLTFVCIFFAFSCEKKEDKDKNTNSTQTNSIAYVDGKYEAIPSIKDDWGGSAKVELTIKGGKITSCAFYSYEADGKLKDADYGKVGGEIKNTGLYKIAQNAVLQSSKYPEMLVETQDIEKLDALSGATVSFALFKDAVKQIMKKAYKNCDENCDDCDDNEDDCKNCKSRKIQL